jgi:hypothetical protein
MDYEAIAFELGQWLDTNPYADREEGFVDILRAHVPPAREQEGEESAREYIATLKEKLHHTEQRANIAEAEEQRVKTGLGISLQNWLDLKNRAEQAEGELLRVTEAFQLYTEKTDELYEQAESEAKALREAAKPLVDAYLCNPDSTSEFVAYRSGKEVIAEWHALRDAILSQPKGETREEGK